MTEDVIEYILLELLFQPGRIFSTTGATDTFDQDDLTHCLRRHLTGDWGDQSPADWNANTAAVQNGGRILSIYEHRGSTLLIITEADRSTTTYLLPEEY